MGRLTTGRQVMQTGEVWVAFLDPAIGHEQQGRRPVIIVSGEELNLIPSELVLIVPATSTNLRVAPHVPIEMAEGHLPRPSWAMSEQLRSVSHQRLRRRIGLVESSTLELVLHRICLFLDVAYPEL